MTRVLVCGGRNYNNRAHVFATLDAIHAETPISVIIHGGAWGADTSANAWAQARDVLIACYAAQWSVHGRRAGTLRNQEMLDQARPDLVVAFPGGVGTAHMTRIARRAGVPVQEVADAMSASQAQSEAL